MPAGPKRPTIRSLAAELRVSPITVSRALRERENVEPSLARRIRAHARKRGYRRDPVLSEVMGGLGRARGARYRETVAFVWTHPAGGAELEEAGARAAAGQLGYRLEVVKPWLQNLAERDVSRILYARGIRGVLLAPNASRPDPRYELDWPKFAAVLVGSSLVNTGLARVTRDYYHDARLALEHLARLGCRRPALVLEASTHERTERRYAAAHAAYAAGRPLLHLLDAAASATEEKARLLRWLDEIGADGVLSEFAHASAWLPRRLPHARLALREGETGTGVRADFLRVGTEAMRLLDALLRSETTGLQAAPLRLLVPGRWQAA